MSTLPVTKGRNQTVKGNVFNLDFFTDGFTEILHKVRAHAGGVTRGVFSLKRGICEFHPTVRTAFSIVSALA